MHESDIRFISTQSGLDENVQQISKQNCIALDTEFCRQHTYRPTLSLLQIGLEDGRCIVIDMLCELQYNDLIDCLSRPNIMKIVHDCKQDLEVINAQYPAFVAQNIWDVQLASLFLGYASPPSYMRLVLDFCTVELCKDLQYSDWVKRPLTSEQLRYAALDVAYLLSIYQSTQELLGQQNKLHWFLQDIQELNSIKYPGFIIENQAAKHVGYARSLQEIEHLLVILYFRNYIAEIHNIHPNKIMHADVVTKLMKSSNLSDIPRHMGRHKWFIQKDFVNFYDTLDKTELAELSQILWDKVQQHKKIPDRDSAFEKEMAFYFSKLQDVAEQYHINPTLLSSKSQLAAVLKSLRNDGKRLVDALPLMRGWRYEIFGCSL
jgi:ribonuclease D